jgi:hypothetical protein
MHYICSVWTSRSCFRNSAWDSAQVLSKMWFEWWKQNLLWYVQFICQHYSVSQIALRLWLARMGARKSLVPVQIWPSFPGPGDMACGVIHTAQRVTEALAATPGSSTSCRTKWTVGPIRTSCCPREFAPKTASWWKKSAKTPLPYQKTRGDNLRPRIRPR